MKPSRVIAACLAAASLSVTAPAFADNGKSGGTGCSPAYTHVTYNTANGELILPDGTPEPNTLRGLQEQIFTIEFADGVFTSLDHNNNFGLCYKVPSGWLEPSNGNGLGGYFVNLVDDYKT